MILSAAIKKRKTVQLRTVYVNLSLVTKSSALTSIISIADIYKTKNPLKRGLLVSSN